MNEHIKRCLILLVRHLGGFLELGRCTEVGPEHLKIRVDENGDYTLWLDDPTHRTRIEGAVSVVPRVTNLPPGKAQPEPSVRGTGSLIHTTLVDRIPEKIAGEHLWVALGMWRVNPTKMEHLLDLENMVSLGSSGCYWCEQVYHPRLLEEPCPGSTEETS